MHLLQPKRHVTNDGVGSTGGLQFANFIAANNNHLFSSDAIAYSGAYFGLGNGPIHLDDVRCTGSEAALINCSYDPFTSDCSHYEDAGVQCGKYIYISFTHYLSHNYIFYTYS